MKWYNNKDANGKVVISSRVRLARNIEQIPFPNKATEKDLLYAAELVSAALSKNYGENLNFISFDSLPAAEKQLLLEDHLVSREFCEKDHKKRLLITNEARSLAIMVNEEDHIRIQEILPGLSLQEAYRQAKRADESLEKDIRLAFDSELGYLTSCPTNLGTGLRASVMLHLPAICAAGRVKALSSLMTKVGLTVRGLYGEGSEADGCIFQVSNQVTLGISEEDTLEKLESAVKEIVSTELELRKKLREQEGTDFDDRLSRSFGILKYAKKLSSKELLSLWSNVKLGTDMGIIPQLQNINLIGILIEAMPAHILKKHPEAADAHTRDVLRAKDISDKLEA